MRKNLLSGATGFVLGAVLIGGAGAALTAGPTGLEPATGLERTLPTIGASVAAQAPSGAQLPAGRFLAGSAKVDITPRADRWVPDTGSCSASNDGCLATFDGPFAKRVREDGVHIRATAISNGASTTVFAVGDLVGWFDSYPADVCGDCGARAIRQAMGAELGIDPNAIVLGSTHTHSSANTVGIVPRWYMEQLRDAWKQAIRAAYADLRPAVLHTGETIERWVNLDRRIVQRAMPDPTLQWLWAREDLGDGQPGATITVLHSYAAHPTVLAANDTLHSGFAGPANSQLEQQLGGGVALWFPSGLGDQKVVRGRGRDGLGNALANAVLRDMLESPRPVASNEIRVDLREVPVIGDNLFMLGARAINYFSRDILPPAGGGPATGRYGKSNLKPTCVGAGPITLNTVVGGIRIGDVAIMTAPGEIFASISLTVKDYLEDADVAFVLGLANDQIGYLIPYVQFDETAHQGPGLGANSVSYSEYEEVLSIGRCAGEHVMDTLIAAGRGLGFAIP